MAENYVYSSVSRRITRSEIRELLKWTRKKGIISFAGGLPDASLFPIDDLCRITDEVLRAKGYTALQYGPTSGESDFIEAVLAHMKSFGDVAAVENFCTISSSQQGLDLVSLLFVDDGEPIICESPTYVGAIQAFHRAGCDMRGIPLEHDGINIQLLKEELASLKKKGKKPRFIYVIPDYQNPSGITLSLEKRKQLIEIAHSETIPIIEDSPYREITFTGHSHPSLWSLSGGKGVIMMKTLSKMLFPGMRLGWMVSEPEFNNRIEMMKQSVDLCTSSFNQLIVAKYIAEGKMRETINKAIACYKPKKEAMVSMLAKHMPEGVTWSDPDGGMFLWVVLPKGEDATEIFEKAARANVVYVTGRAFHADHSGENTMRLNYSFPSIADITEGVERLARVIREERSSGAKHIL